MNKETPKTKRPLYRELASLVEARLNCEKSGNAEWFDRHTESIEELCRQYLPHGSGFDSGTKLDFDRSNGEKLVFTTAYHHMNEAGMYDGWTAHVVTVRSSLFHGFTLSISGRDRNEIKEYINDMFYTALTEEIEIS